ncbi:hypothetical protein K503DRAFT_870277 [Rhizopogon vinicolor AM-OR11-026]|uniref:Acetyl-CoA synthetase-like protein n=1 Tax=Rhizopogon vinicolor AM-OR11-026 TaxID=1314800 RepID=A0A1B7MHX6_9AGAM|nr:hypothetical protein K503DRAFT_870277 [Rhizopogon vinicolor AM-OR11-026]
MSYKSFFPDPPKVPESNVHHLLLNRPDQQEWPDYTLFVNVATGQRRSFKEFVERVRDGATVLGADVAQGGLGLCPDKGDFVMLSHGNITHALLALTVYGMELSKVQAPPVWNTPEGIQISFNVVPLYHTLGLYFTNFFNFLNRSTTILLPKWDIEVFFDSIPK